MNPSERTMLWGIPVQANPAVPPGWVGVTEPLREELNEPRGSWFWNTPTFAKQSAEAYRQALRALYAPPSPAPPPFTVVSPEAYRLIVEHDGETAREALREGGLTLGDGCAYTGVVTRTDPEENTMPATTATPASPRQISYINALRAERGMSHLAPSVERSLTGGRNGTASRAISELLATPRTPGTRSAAQRRNDGDEQLCTPSSTTRAGRMLLAGRLTATVTAPDGEHFTFELRSRRRNNGRWQTVAPDVDGARIYVTSNGRRVATIHQGYTAEWARVLEGTKNALRNLFAFTVGTQNSGDLFGDPGAQYRIQEESRCGRCGRALTDPESIDRGIGPECYGIITRSRHGQVEAPVDEANRVREALSFAADAMSTPDPTRSDDVGCGGCDNDEHCGACRCCPDAFAAHDAAFAAREREQERAAFASDPDYRASLTELAEQVTTTTTQPTRNDALMAARDTIELALKAAQEDEEITEQAAREALATFDRLAAR